MYSNHCPLNYSKPKILNITTFRTLTVSFLKQTKRQEAAWLGTFDEANLRRHRQSRSKQNKNFVSQQQQQQQTNALKLLVYSPYQICHKVQKRTINLKTI